MTPQPDTHIDRIICSETKAFSVELYFQKRSYRYLLVHNIILSLHIGLQGISCEYQRIWLLTLIWPNLKEKVKNVGHPCNITFVLHMLDNPTIPYGVFRNVTIPLITMHVDVSPGRSIIDYTMG